MTVPLHCCIVSQEKAERDGAQSVGPPSDKHCTDCRHSQVTTGCSAKLLKFLAINGLVQRKTYRTPSIFPLSIGFSCRFSLQPIHWNWNWNLLVRWWQPRFSLPRLHSQVEILWGGLQSAEAVPFTFKGFP